MTTDPDDDTPPAITDQFGGLPMGDLIGGPLAAASRANAQLAEATLDFIDKIGFTPSTEGVTPDPRPGRTGPLLQPTTPAIGAVLPEKPILPFAPSPEKED